jgi:hypothetical protein
VSGIQECFNDDGQQQLSRDGFGLAGSSVSV